MGKSLNPDKPRKEKKEKKSKSKSDGEASLSSFLLGGLTDSSKLDDIFANSKGPALKLTPAPIPAKSKKSKAAVQAPVDEEEEAEEVPNDADLSSVEGDLSDLEGDEDEDDETGVEEAYAARKAVEKLRLVASGGGKKRKAEDSDVESEDEQSAGEDEEEEEELDIEKLMQDSVLPRVVYKEVPLSASEVKGRKAKEGKAEEKKRREEESPEERDKRTIFLGNVPVACSTSKSLKKALIRHVLQSDSLQTALSSLSPATPIHLKAATIRFRSLAFASTVFGRKADEKAEGDEKEKEEGRGRKRAKEWKDKEDSDARGVRGGKHAAKEEEATTSNGKGKKALTDGQKRRVAFIRGDLNEGKKVCNAYLVLTPLPPSSPSMDTIIKLIVEHSNGTTFEGQTLRSDFIRPKSSAALLAAAQMKARPDSKISLPASADAGATYKVPPVEARRTVFIGGLDFAETEEEVRKAVMSSLVRERGEGNWVEGVRLIRDASSGLGKGFGYVLMADSTCVDHLLTLPPGHPLKVSKRKVRLERCKTGVAAARAKAASATAAALKAKASASPAAIPAPRPPKLSNAQTASAHQAKLAEALAKLAPGERKAIKAEDPERLMRRAQKKKNKVLKERWERKQGKSGKEDVLGRETRGEIRARKEKKRVKEGNKTGKRAKKVYT